MKKIIKHSALFIFLTLLFGCFQSGDNKGKKGDPLDTAPKVQNAKVSTMDDMECYGEGGICVQIDASPSSKYTICFDVYNGTPRAVVLNTAQVLLYLGDVSTNPILIDTCVGSIVVNDTIPRSGSKHITRSYCMENIHLFGPTAQIGFNLKFDDQPDTTTYILDRCTKSQ